MSHIFGFDSSDAFSHENGFYLTAPQARLQKLIAHYELYKRITRLPGHVVECGVFKGASLIRLATFRNMLEAEQSRKVIGFDAFGKFPATSKLDADTAFIERFERDAGDGIPIDELRKALQHKAIGNVELIEGDLTLTLPDYVAAHPELKVALLHIDVDVYEPTRVVLEQLYDHVVPGGLVVLDDYGTVYGETRAVDEFLEGKGIALEKLSCAHIPAFFTKPVA